MASTPQHSTNLECPRAPSRKPQDPNTVLAVPIEGAIHGDEGHIDFENVNRVLFPEGLEQLMASFGVFGDT